MLKDFPESEQFCRELATEHRVHDYADNSLFLAQFEFFLSLKDLPGFEGKLTELRRYQHGSGSNQGYVGWAGFCAELTALTVLTKLGFKIQEFESLSPRRTTDQKTCDFRAARTGGEYFIEVKCKASEEKQTPPELLRKQIEAAVAGKFHYALQLHDRNFASGDDGIIAQLREWIDSPTNRRRNGFPRPFQRRDFSVHFYSNGPSTFEVSFIDRDMPIDVEKWLLVTGLSGNNGEPMKPQVQQAAEKGADWLMCAIHPWDALDQFLKRVIKPSTGEGLKLRTTDPRLGALTGVIASQSTCADNFCIVERSK
jgi:hypothetical protein